MAARHRAAFLDEACGDDASLRREVESLLAGRSEADAFLETPAWAVSATPLTPGTHLGPYEIQSAIGAGGMGEVYRARFEREARTVAALNHPHICTLHDVGEDGGRTFLVMEHLDGRTLAERLKKGPLRLEQALTVAAEIADALAAAHRSGVIHRDLKPSNVMLTKSGATLLDFGLAKWAGHGEPQATPTNTAPLTGQGVIIYEMVTGQRPFAGKSTTSLVAAILEHEPESIVAASSSSRTGGAS